MTSHQHDPALSPASPRHVAVVGAGMVGLSTAWFLQEAGVQVTVYERDHVAAGASWGNAGWLTPDLTAPLPEPAVLRYGVRAVLSPRSPVYVPLRADRNLLRFLTGFVAASTPRRWRRGMAAYVPLNQRALEAFDVLAAGGVSARTQPARPFLACFRREKEAQALLTELAAIRDAGQDPTFFPVTGWQARGTEPALTDSVGAAVEIHGQRYLNPPEFLRSLAVAVGARGGEILEGREVSDLQHRSGGVTVCARPAKSVGTTPSCWPAVRSSATWPAGSGCGSRSRPAAGTASACRWSRCPAARCTSRSSGWPARRWTGGCAWPG